MAIYKLRTQGNKTTDGASGSVKAPTASHALQAHDSIIIELIAACLEHPTFLAVSHALVNELARQLDCERVSLKLNRNGQRVPQAISSSAGINPDAGIINLIADAMHEALDQKTSIVFPASHNDELLIHSAHERLASSLSPKSVCTVLLTQNHEIIGALTLERRHHHPFDNETVSFCQRVALLVGPLLLLKYEEEHWLLERAWGGLRQWWQRLSKQGHYTEKSLYGLGIILTLFLAFADGTHRVSGDALLEGSVRSADHRRAGRRLHCRGTCTCRRCRQERAAPGRPG